MEVSVHDCYPFHSAPAPYASFFQNLREKYYGEIVIKW